MILLRVISSITSCESYDNVAPLLLGINNGLQPLRRTVSGARDGMVVFAMIMTLMRIVVITPCTIAAKA